MKNKLLLPIILVIIIVSTFLSGCEKAYETPYMTDRTNETEFSIYGTYSIDMEKYDLSEWRKHIELTNSAYCNKDICYGSIEDRENAIEVANEIVVGMIPDAKQKISKAKLNNDKDAWICRGNDVYVVIAKDSGVLLFAADISGSEFISHRPLNHWQLDFLFDLSKMSAKEIRDYGAFVGLLYGSRSYGELDKVQVFKETVKEGSKEAPWSNGFGKVGGEYSVYYSENSNSWIVVTDSFVHVVTQKHGERLYFNSIPKERTFLSETWQNIALHSYALFFMIAG